MLLLLCRDRAGYLTPVRPAVARLAAQRSSQRARRSSRDWLRRGDRRPVRAFRGAPRRRRAGAGRAASRGSPSAWRAAGPRSSRAAITSNCSAPGIADGEALVAALRCALAGRLALAGGRHASGAVPRARTTSRRTRRACASPPAACSPIQRRPKRSRPSSISSRQARDGRAVRRPAAKRSTTRSRSRERCNLELDARQEPACPRSRCPTDETLDSYLAARRARASRARLDKHPAVARKTKRRATASGSRSRLGAIVQMGFPGYFLIVADFINWAKDHGVPVGPGRGSGAGSLVACALGITDLDPLPYDLLFERFLNPERVSMPDFDIDFCKDGRDRVIDYVRGEVRRATASRRSSPSAPWRRRRWCATAGRVLGLGYNFCDQHREADPVAAGQAITLEDAREMEPLLGRARGEAKRKCASCSSSAREARGPDAQRRQARRRRADRARAR